MNMNEDQEPDHACNHINNELFDVGETLFCTADRLDMIVKVQSIKLNKDNVLQIQVSDSPTEKYL